MKGCKPFIPDRTWNLDTINKWNKDYHPYGQPGDILWVRETTCHVMLEHAHDLLEGAKDKTQFVYKCNVHSDWMEYAKEKYGYKWTPSIFMPKAACRIFLKVVSVRVEWLQFISEADAQAEGTPFIKGVGEDIGRPWAMSFAALWQKINGNWDDAPRVWVIEFETVERPEGFV